MLQLSSMGDPSVKNGLAMLTAFYGYDVTKFNVSKEIKERMDRGLSYEDAVRDMIDKVKNMNSFCKNFFTEENIEIMVKQAIEDKEWLLR